MKRSGKKLSGKKIKMSEEKKYISRKILKSGMREEAISICLLR